MKKEEVLGEELEERGLAIGGKFFFCFVEISCSHFFCVPVFLFFGDDFVFLFCQIFFFLVVVVVVVVVVLPVWN